MSMDDPKQRYLDRCAKKMKELHGGPIKIKVTEAANPSNYPSGTWFDDLVGQVLEPAGVDTDAIPNQYIMANGDAIPFSCAEVVQVNL